MNIYGIFILIALLFDFIVNSIADILNSRANRQALPEEMKDYYSREKLDQSQAYSWENTRLSLWASAFNLIMLLGFWFLEGFNHLDQWVRSWPMGSILTGLVYIGILLMGQSLLNLPFKIYSTFVIEERFGFNKSTVQVYFGDRLKGLALSIILGAPLMAGVLAFFEYSGSLAWVYCWGLVAGFMIFIQFVAPTWIMPMFNKFTPLENNELKASLFNYAKSVDFPLKNISVMDGSKRSTKSNAFFSGFGKNKRIALFDTLIEEQTVPELTAVLAHEIGHYKQNHILKNLLISVFHMGLLFFVMSLFLSQKGLFDAFYMESASIYAGLLFFTLLYSPVELVLSIGLHALSRRFEFEADHFAARTIKNPEHLIEGLKKLSVNHLSTITPHPFYVFLNYSHPPILERIGRIRSATS